MGKEYTIPQILSIAGIQGYTPKLAGAVNQLLNAKTDIEYKDALALATVEITGYNDVNIYETEDLNAYSGINHFDGLPIYMPLLFERIDGASDDLYLPNAIIEVSRQKNIVTTQVQGRDTSVKEFINNGDYSISVKGVVANKKQGYPKNEVQELVKYFEAKKSISVVHEVLNMLGIYEIVITDYDLPSNPFVNMQAYSFSALSETPIELSNNKR